MLQGSSALSKFHTSLSKVLHNTLALCQSKATLPKSHQFCCNVPNNLKIPFFFLVVESNHHNHVINDQHWAKVPLAQYEDEDCCFKVSLEVDGNASVLCPGDNRSDLKLTPDGDRHFDLSVLNGVGKIITIIDKNDVKLIHPITEFHEVRPEIHRQRSQQSYTDIISPVHRPPKSLP